MSLPPSNSRQPATEPDTIILQMPAGCLKITFLKPALVRVRWTSAPEFSARHSWAVTAPDESFSGAPVTLTEDADHLHLDGSLFNVIVDKGSGQISFEDNQGQPFFADMATPQPGPAGVTCTKITRPGECFYAFGQRASLQLERSGRKLENWATDPDNEHNPSLDPMYMAVPVLIGLHPQGPAYGVYLNHTGRSAMDLTVPGQLTFSAHGRELDYYLVYGPLPADVVKGFADLLGTMPLPPRWALGYHQSRWSYTPETELRRIASEMRQRELPCDSLHLDIDYMRHYRVFTWNDQRFPDPAVTIRDLHQQGFHVVAIVDPGVKVDPSFSVYREGLERKMFVSTEQGAVFQGCCWPDEAVFPDFLRPDVRYWWGNLQKALTEAGVDGIWNDMNEPAIFSQPFSRGTGVVGTLPEDALQGPEKERTTHAEAHNLYGSGMAQASYEGMRRLLNGSRPFILNRSGFAGIQRWSASWMGDNSSTWEHLEMSLPQLMNMSLCGIPFTGVDIGGFSGHATPELFARWIEAGILYPFCRNHTSVGTRPQEPWEFGSQVEVIARTYLNLRYRLLPYLYSLFHQAATRGEPVLRPLLYHFPQDPATYHLHDQAMLGAHILAAPVVKPGLTARAVYLPEGGWYDYWTDEYFEGPAHILAQAPLDRLPLYVRAGTVLPLGPVMQFSSEKPLNPLTLEVYPGQGSFSLYEDDGETFEFVGGDTCSTDYRTSCSGDQLVVECSQREGLYVPAARRAVLRVHLRTGIEPLEESFEDDGSPHHFIFTLS